MIFKLLFSQYSEYILSDRQSLKYFVWSIFYHFHTLTISIVAHVVYSFSHVLKGGDVRSEIEY